MAFCQTDRSYLKSIARGSRWAVSEDLPTGPRSWPLLSRRCTFIGVPDPTRTVSRDEDMKRTTLLAIAALSVLAVVFLTRGRQSETVASPTAGDAVQDVRQIPTYEVEAWPEIPNDWVLGLASGLASDSQDHIWIIHRPRTVPEESRDRAAPAVLEFDTDGNFIQGWGGADYRDSNEFEWPSNEHGIAVDGNGYVWIAGSGGGDDQILKFTREGDFVMQIGRAGASQGNLDTQNVNRPADVFVYEPSDEVFVADGYGNRRIIVFDATTGAFKRMWDAYGNPPSDPTPDEAEWDPQHFHLVHGVRIANDGLVYVSDSQSMRLQVFTPDGEFLTEKNFGRFPDPDPEVMAARANDMSFGEPTTNLITATATAHRSVNRTAFSPDAEQRWLYIAERSNHQVVVLDRETLEEITRFGQHGDELGESYVLHDMTADSEGNIYTVEVNNIGGVRKRTQKFTFTGTMPAPSM